MKEAGYDWAERRSCQKEYRQCLRDEAKKQHEIYRQCVNEVRYYTWFVPLCLLQLECCSREKRLKILCLCTLRIAIVCIEVLCFRHSYSQE